MSIHSTGPLCSKRAPYLMGAEYGCESHRPAHCAGATHTAGIHNNNRMVRFD